MLSIDSSTWRIRSYNGTQVHITQRASRMTRTVDRSALPTDEELAAMHETRFNKICRELFHDMRERGQHALTS